MSTKNPSYDGAPYEVDEDRHRRRIADAIANIMLGKINVTKDVTLAASVGSTTVLDPRIGYFSALIPAMPLTANAATELGNGTLFVAQATMGKGSAVITHANNAQVDRTIRFVIIG
jgi:hypothetical protein